jgi:polyisoprenoid-binding protein YceI
MKKLLLIAIPVLLLAGAAAAGAWWVFLRDDAPGRASLDNLPVATTVAGSSGSSAPSTPNGTWAVQQGPDVFAGYRVQEQFAVDTVKRTAAGRSPAVTGSMVVAGNSVSAARFDVDMTKLNSGSDRRDGRMRTAGLQTDSFPTASFQLTKPIVLPSTPQLGVPFDVQALGDLTMHGVTRSVPVQLRARWDGSSIAVTGGTLVAMADFNIVPPSVGGFVSVDNGGVIELQLVLTPAP